MLSHARGAGAGAAAAAGAGAGVAGAVVAVVDAVAVGERRRRAVAAAGHQVDGVFMVMGGVGFGGLGGAKEGSLYLSLGWDY